jgi:saccharopine dehydrogenase-like NADP-dependent oxidoreductase
VWVTGSSSEDEALGTLRDFIHEEFGEVRTFVDGRWVTVTGFKDGAEEVELGSRRVIVYHAGHTEPITMPRYFPDLRAVSCKGNVVPFGLAELIRKAVEIGFNSTNPVAVGGEQVSPLEFLASYLHSPAAMSFYDRDSLSFHGGLLIRVVGMRGGKEETEVFPLVADAEGRTSSASAGMAASTGVPIAVVSEAIVLGEVQRRGAYAPEAIGSTVAKKLLGDVQARLEVWLDSGHVA